MYAALAKGRGFGEAATEGRKHLQLNPERWVGLEPRPLQDWFVPVAYEATPIQLLSAKQSISLTELSELDPVQTNPSLLRYVPEEGFVGRDETLLALDRSFDKHRVVLLHAYAGQGKSSTAVEFARWYALTGGLGEQPIVLLASFETHTDLDDLLNQIGQTFASVLEAQGIQWGTINESHKRRGLVMQLLRHFPVLWIWDNVEPVAGFPEGTESRWTGAERKELSDFLKQLKMDDASQVKILLTSRRNEQKWLGGIPHRIPMERMRDSDAARLARKLGEERNLSPSETADWQPLLDYCLGNPLTLRVLVSQAVKGRLRGRQQIANFVEAIRRGEQQIEDVDEKQGRDKSLGASLNYGFRNAFKEDELPIIALLHLFQGTVDVYVLQAMGKGEWALPALKGKTREYLADLMTRAKEIGVLTEIGKGYFDIHPALPWFLHQLFAQYYDSASGHSTAETATRSWVEAVGGFANYYSQQFDQGQRNAVVLLESQESSLLHAHYLARKNEWWSLVTACMQGLQTLYDYQGRFAEWARLVEQIRPDYCTAQNEPIEGREDFYEYVIFYLVQLADHYERDLPKAIALQEKLIERSREKARVLLAMPPDVSLDEPQTNLLRNVGTSLSRLADLQSNAGDVNCVGTYEKAITVYRRIGDKMGEAIAEWNRGNSCKDLSAIRDLDAAEAAFSRSLGLHDPNDALGRTKCIRQMGLVHLERFWEALKGKKPPEVYLTHARAAEECCYEALKLCPKDALNDLSPIHNTLGSLYLGVGELKNALEHFERRAQLEERIGNRYGAGATRFNMALVYCRAADEADKPSQQRAHWERARAYAEAALRDYESYGGHAAKDELDAEQVLDRINQSISELTS